MSNLDMDNKETSNKSKVTVEFDYDIGQKVIIKCIDMPGRVVSLCKAGNNIQYQVVFWNKGDRESLWLDNWEITSI